MGKKEEIRIMATTLNPRCVPEFCDCYECGNRGSCRQFQNAETLANYGYRSLKNFVEWLKTKSMTQDGLFDYIVTDNLDELLKEYLECVTNQK